MTDPSTGHQTCVSDGVAVSRLELFQLKSGKIEILHDLDRVNLLPDVDEVSCRPPV